MVPTHVICASVLEMYLKILTGVSLVYLLFLFILIFILLLRNHQDKFKMYGKYDVGNLGPRWWWVPRWTVQADKLQGKKPGQGSLETLANLRYKNM